MSGGAVGLSGVIREKERAARVVYEIIRQNGGTFENKTNLFKAFWKAHLHYTSKFGGYLTGWPIVRMPRGPGIGDFKMILGELMQEGLVDVEERQVGPYPSFFFAIVDGESPAFSLTPDEIEAIKLGVEETTNKSASRVSHESHVDSRVWREASDGDELNIYLDLLGDEEYEDMRRQANRTANDITAAILD